MFIESCVREMFLCFIDVFLDSPLVIIMFSLFNKLARPYRLPCVKLSGRNFFWDSFFTSLETAAMKVSTVGSEFIGVHFDFLISSIWIISV